VDKNLAIYNAKTLSSASKPAIFIATKKIKDTLNYLTIQNPYHMENIKFSKNDFLL